MKTKSFDRSKAVITAFVRAYIEAALWSTPDDTEEVGDKCLDANFDMRNLSDECLQSCIQDCAKFQKENEELLSQAGTDEQNGHDFWLTRNRHGAGFWCRDYEKTVGEKLTEAAHDFGEVYLYVANGDEIWSH